MAYITIKLTKKHSPQWWLPLILTDVQTTKSIGPAILNFSSILRRENCSSQTISLVPFVMVSDPLSKKCLWYTSYFATRDRPGHSWGRNLVQLLPVCSPVKADAWILTARVQTLSWTSNTFLWYHRKIHLTLEQKWFKLLFSWCRELRIIEQI